jgi:hypothetical protein
MGSSAKLLQLCDDSISFVAGHHAFSLGANFDLVAHLQIEFFDFLGWNALSRDSFPVSTPWQ